MLLLLDNFEGAQDAHLLSLGIFHGAMSTFEMGREDTPWPSSRKPGHVTETDWQFAEAAAAITRLYRRFDKPAFSPLGDSLDDLQ